MPWEVGPLLQTCTHPSGVQEALVGNFEVHLFLGGQICMLPAGTLEELMVVPPNLEDRILQAEWPGYNAIGPTGWGWETSAFIDAKIAVLELGVT